MLKKNVIRKNFEFQEIIDKKIQLISKTLILYYRTNNQGLRIGISVSKKFANAVNRNRYRRQVRAIMDELNYYNLKKDVVLILRKSFLTMSYQNKLSEIKKIFTRLENAK